MPELMTFDRRNAQVYRAVNERFAEQLEPLLAARRPHLDPRLPSDGHGARRCAPAASRCRSASSCTSRSRRRTCWRACRNPPPWCATCSPPTCSASRPTNDAENFAEAACPHGVGAQRGAPGWLHLEGRRIRLGVFPVEIEPHEFAATAQDSWLATPAERLRRSLSGQSLILGVDRLDPTKGLLQRLAGYRRLLETRPNWHRRVTLLQIAAESRKDVVAYRDLRAAIERDAGRINSAFSEADWTPLRLIARAGARNTIAGYMREARVGLVTPLRDGMNLVAKEYIAAQDPQDPGVLVLSRFAGAAQQLDAALLVNPHDADEMADALDTALTMSLAERQVRWRQCWDAIKDTSAVGWGRGFVAALLRATARRPFHAGAGEPATSLVGERNRETNSGMRLI